MAMIAEQQHVTDEWNTGAVDITAYLERIGEPRLSPSAEALHRLHRAHVRTIPFENVDVVLRSYPGLGLADIQAKLLHRRRGGYCYEHALLFAAVLERLGFTVTRYMARVEPTHPGPYTHMMLVVSVDGADYLADVGFGAGILEPMPLREDTEVDQAGWPHRLRREGSGWTLERWAGGRWEPLHAFDPIPSRPVDYEVAHHYTATHPNSPFVGKPVVMRLDQGRLRKLVGTEFVVETPEGESGRETVPPERLGETLRELDVELTQEELSALRTELGW
nr:arylamine N-acetyltransferase [Actinopolyspora mortivallis]